MKMVRIRMSLTLVDMRNVAIVRARTNTYGIKLKQIYSRVGAEVSRQNGNGNYDTPFAVCGKGTQHEEPGLVLSNPRSDLSLCYQLTIDMTGDVPEGWLMC